jgi:hypothetical protein
MRRAKPAARKDSNSMTNAEAGTEKADTVAEQGAHVAPKKAASRKGATKKKGAPKGQRAAKGAKPKASPKKEAKAKKGGQAAREKQDRKLRAESKGSKILDLLRRAKGATLAQIMEATGWQAHSVRGFISTAAKKHNITIESVRSEDKERTYRITA